MEAHRLTDAAFAALGAGRPDAATLAELGRARLSRTRLVLREIGLRAPAGFAELAAAEKTDPDLVRRTLGDPMTGLWAAAALADLRAGRAAEARLTVRAPDGPVLRAGHAGREIAVRVEQSHPSRARLGLTPATLTAADVARWQDRLADAWRLLTDRHPGEADLIAAVLRCVVPVETDPGTRGISATATEAYGAVALSEPADGHAFAVGLLHEIRHSLLNAVQYLFDLHDGPAAAGYSPWRDDPRPPAGILHGAYAYLGVAKFWRAEPGRIAQFEFARWRSAVASAARGLLAGGGLTRAGARFVTALLDEVLPWLDEPVDPEVARLAAGANADHYLHWRLRNLAIDPAAARALAVAWQYGHRPPPLPEPRITGVAGRALPWGARLDRTHAMLRGTPAGDGAPGDAAWLRGDLGTAIHAYRKSIGTDAGDDTAWTGLALASGRTALLERPEVVVAAYRQLPEGTDPLAFADWVMV